MEDSLCEPLSLLRYRNYAIHRFTETDLCKQDDIISFEALFKQGNELLHSPEDQYPQAMCTFLQMFEHVHIQNISFSAFTEIHLPENLVSHFDVSISSNCILSFLRFLVCWVEADFEHIALISSIEFAFQLMNIIFPNGNPPIEQIQIRALILVEHMAINNPKISIILISHNALKLSVDLYKENKEPKIRSRLICFMFSLTASHPPFNLVIGLTDIFYDAFQDSQLPYLDLLINLGSAFIECDSIFISIFAEICDLTAFIGNFERYSPPVQMAIFSLLMRVFEGKDNGVVSILVNSFSWNPLQKVFSSDDKNLKASFYRMLCTGFARAPILATFALEKSNYPVFDFIFSDAKAECYDVKKFATVALLHALTYGFNIVYKCFFDHEFISIMTDNLSTEHSKVITGRIFLASFAIKKFAEVHDINNVLCLFQDVEINPSIPLSYYESSEISSLAEALKDVLEEIDKSKFWIFN